MHNSGPKNIFKIKILVGIGPLRLLAPKPENSLNRNSLKSQEFGKETVDCSSKTTNLPTC